MGQVLSFETSVPGCRWRRTNRRQHRGRAIDASAQRTCGVGDPEHVEKLHAREPGDLVAARDSGPEGERDER
jgi:hypothetical protein